MFGIDRLISGNVPIRGRTPSPGQSSPDGSVAESERVLQINGIKKSFEGEPAVAGIDLDIHDGELLTLLGPSGCGKTTMLRILAGLEQPDAGRVTLDDTLLCDANTCVPPEDRDVGLVFQDFALFPHMSARENVAFGLHEMAGSVRSNRVTELLELVGLAEQADKRVGDLSGGQRQRIALARSLAVEPDVLLLDEPFSNLDVDLRVRMREDVRRILKEAGVTAISVTHDQEEALSISDRVAVMHEGRIEQVGRPETVFQHPTSRFVASFLGHASFLSGWVAGDVIETAIGRIGRDQIHGLATQYDHMWVDVMVRPDDVIAQPVDDAAEANGTVTYRRYLGPTVLYRVELENGDVVECMHNHSEDIELDEAVRVSLPATHPLAWFPKEAAIGDRTAE